MRVLISSAGRRVGLIRCFRDSFRKLGMEGKIIAVDASLDAPALQFADSCWQSPRAGDREFIPRLLAFARSEQIKIIVPTIDPELAVYARARHRFADAGIAVSISAFETVAICADKQETHYWLRDLGVPVPRQWNLASLASRSSGRSAAGETFPLIVKPRNGSGSIGVRRVESGNELVALLDTIASTGSLEDYVVEQIAPGCEYTINVFVDSQGVCRAAVPHRRIEVRAGEVSKAVTRRHPVLISLATRVAENLPGARGPLSIQCFLGTDDSVLVTEINARFGGGYPLAHQAGARFTDWLLEPWYVLGSSHESCAHTDFSYACCNSKRKCNDWLDQLTMLRFDQEVFLSPGVLAAPDG